MEIVHFDPEKHYITVTKIILSTNNLDLAGSASSRGKMKKLLNSILKGKIKPKVAILEAHLGKTFEDGEKLAERLRAAVPDIKIIGYSTLSTQDWADIEVIKSKEEGTSITKALEELSGKKFLKDTESKTDLS